MKQTPRTHHQPLVASAVCTRAAGSDSRHCREWGVGWGTRLPSEQPRWPGPHLFPGPWDAGATEWDSTALENREAEALHVPACQGTANLPEVLHVCF